jgi:hypothetical protein
MTVSMAEREFTRLEGPEYDRLSREEKTQLLRRLMKVYAANHYPHRVPAVHAEAKKILKELKEKKT